ASSNSATLNQIVGSCTAIQITPIPQNVVSGELPIPFTAILLNGGNSSTAVTWTVTCATGGTTCGTIDSNGTYHAPTSSASAQPITITAASVANSSIIGTITFTLAADSL